jgi:hypothetical protein
MKKNVRFICFGFFLVIANFNSVIAQLKSTEGKCKNYPNSAVSPLPVKRMVIPYIPDTIILDGIKDAAFRDSFLLTSVVYFPTPSGETKYAAGDYRDHGAVVSAGWRNEGLYLFAHITDNKDYGGANWSQDGMQIDINADTTDDDDCGNWTSGDWEIGINRDTNVVRYSNASLGDAYHAIIPNCNGFAAGADTGKWGFPFIYYGKHIPGVKFAMTNNIYKGYTIEALYPWGFLTPGVPVDSVIKRTMGFDIAIADNDVSYFPTSSGGRDHSLIWDQDAEADSGTIQTGLPINADAVNLNTKLMGRITFQQRIATEVHNPTETNAFLMFPNPAGSVVNFTNLNDMVSLDFINILGKTEKRIPISSGSILVQLNDLKKGMYLVSGKTASGKVYIRKLIIN